MVVYSDHMNVVSVGIAILVIRKKENTSKFNYVLDQLRWIFFSKLEKNDRDIRKKFINEKFSRINIRK